MKYFKKRVEREINFSDVKYSDYNNAILEYQSDTEHFIVVEEEVIDWNKVRLFLAIIVPIIAIILVSILWK